MPEHEKYFFNGDKNRPGRKITEEVSERFIGMLGSIAVENNQTPSDIVRNMLRFGFRFLQDPAKGGSGGMCFVEDEDGKTSLVVSSIMFDTARAMYPDLPVVVIPDPLA